jgi:hypothetical protein
MRQLLPPRRLRINLTGIRCKQCDAVIHLVGDMTGTVAKHASVEIIAERYPDLADRIPELKAAFDGVLDISYTQWEAYLAIYHKKELLVAVPARTAPREPDTYIKSADQNAAQQTHLGRLRQYQRFPITFTNGENLALQLYRSTLYELLTSPAF